MKTNLIRPDWAVPVNIRCLTTNRRVGTGQSNQSQDTPYASFNLATHVADKLELVLQNRVHLENIAALPASPLWLNQTHSTRVLEYNLKHLNADADASFTTQANQVSAVMTADCLPVLFTSTQGDWVAASHAGWRGLVDGILLETLKTYTGDGQILAWIGPAISQKHFEVGEELRQQFCQLDIENQTFFKPSDKAENKWLCDLTAIAERQLLQQGVRVTQSGLCTFENEDDFYSYRRDGITGRMASLIWIEPSCEAES